MDLAGLAGLDDQADLGAQPLSDQVVVNGGGGEERRNGDAVDVQASVGENEDVASVAHRLGGPFAQPVAAHGRDALRHPRPPGSRC